MDLALGGFTPLTKTAKLLSATGATAKNYFIHTPICCPSRSELLTGKCTCSRSLCVFFRPSKSGCADFHNIKTANPTDRGCMHVNASLNTTLSPFYTAEWYFAPHLQRAGYSVGIFGKHLNDGYTANNPACPPIGVDRWFANGGGTYFSPSFNNATAGGGP